MNPQPLYNVAYRFFRVPWELGPRAELVQLLQQDRLRRGRAIDLGCGTGANAIFLAAHGFDVTGVDFAPAALDKARGRAAAAGVGVRFIEGDLTALPPDLGRFDLLLDYGTLDDLPPRKRASYVENVVPLAAPGAQFLLWGFEWPPRWWERAIGLPPLVPGEVQDRFGGAFDVERVAASERLRMWRIIPGFAAYLMTRRRDGGAS
jgi:SAM-dependent methyltransferase